MKTISLTQGKVALVDDADFEAVNAHKWYAHKIGRTFYAVRNIRKPDGSGASQLLHQFLLPGVPQIDHEDGDGCNNQRNNIRPATSQQNNQGFRQKGIGMTSKFRGVHWHKRNGKWKSEIEVDGKKIYLGCFNAEEDAARAYDTAAREHYADFASLNFSVDKQTTV